MADLSSFEHAFVSSVANERLQLVILPTEKCNFRCTYCYEDFALGRMSNDTVSAVKNLIARRAPTLNSLVITWFGGEPLLAQTVIDEISLHILELCDTYQNLKYSSSVTTNGYSLDTACLTKLVALGIRDYQISLDGPRQFHDQTRLRADGTGTFDDIYRNLLMIRSSKIDARIMLRLHITPENLDAMPDFVAEIRDRFLADPRFSILFMPVAKLGGSNDAKFNVIDHSRTRAIIRQLVNVAQGGSPIEAAPPDMPCAPGVHDVCYAAKPNSFVIRADGRLGKCTVDLDHPSNQIGHLAADGTLVLENDVLAKWFKGWQSQDWAHLSCPKEAFFDHHPTPGTAIPLPWPTSNARKSSGVAS